MEDQVLPTDSLFATELWFNNWLSAFGEQRAGIWRYDKETVSIPYVIAERRLGPFTIRVAESAANSHTPCYDVLGAIPSSASTFTDMMAELQVSMLRFWPVSARSRVGLAFSRPAPGLWQDCRVTEMAPFVDCRGPWEEYWTVRGKRTRQDWSRHERQLSKQGAELAVLQTRGDAESALPEIFAVEASGWKGDKGSAIEQDPQTVAFYSQLVRDWSDEGCLRLFLLRVHDRIVAFQLCGLWHNVLTSLKIGYLQEYATYSPGQVLQLKILRWAFAQPDVAWFHLCGPATEAKKRWSTGEEPLWTFSAFAHTPMGVAAGMYYALAPAIQAKLQSSFPSVFRARQAQPRTEGLT